MKKAFRLKLLELCKTRGKKSSPDMFNFHVDLPGHDMVTDTARASTCRRKLEAPSLQTKSTINEGPPENMGLTGKSSNTSDEEKQNTLQAVTKQPRGTHGP